MPIKIADGLPAKKTLHEEHIFALEEEVASQQNIRPLKVAILNLMPTKIETETQILRLISKSPLQVDPRPRSCASSPSRRCRSTATSCA